MEDGRLLLLAVQYQLSGLYDLRKQNKDGKTKSILKIKRKRTYWI
jgi:hypothetical protein